MSGAVVVVGSLHYDLMVEAPDRPRKGETVTGQAWYPKFGGKGGNQAVAAAQAGAQTRFVGAVGEDDFAQLMLSTLRDAGIATDDVQRIAGCGTGMSVAIVDAEGDYGAVIVSGANLHIDTAQFADPALWQDAKVLILQNEVPEAVNFAAARAAQAHGLRICLNAAPHRALSPALRDALDVLVVNAIEAEDMGTAAVSDLASAEAAAISLSEHIPTVVVTAGGDGVAWAERGKGSGALPAHPVDVVSTHGAGDAFIGTLCRALAEDLPLQPALEQASTAAAAHISRTHRAS
ncbi:PfkB family carbohydrate kinase [uncultured Roseobacter sp.]|uniref:PfkB family carbohydrate kinase n=1 Tax=uncultured Roseobacter sp. TaxID=114847 RepID=UPI00260BFFA6|nr:PfkB family carbohydrate kinase [uncultured Roseobacter sp.]